MKALPEALKKSIAQAILAEPRKRYTDFCAEWNVSIFSICKIARENGIRRVRGLGSQAHPGYKEKA